MVDDEIRLVGATVQMLGRELSNPVRGSADPREVEGWITQEKPTALITDVRMPHINGLELVSHLHQRWGAVPVVVITAWPSSQVQEDARNGRFAYLPKPFSYSALRDTLTQICKRQPPSAFSGAIAVSMLGEVVQLYGLAARTGTLTVVSPSGKGLIAFNQGHVVDAQALTLSGVAAFNTILSWNSGNFTWSATAPIKHTIHMGLSELLLEAYRLRDEAEAGIKGDSEGDVEFEIPGENALASAEQQPVGNLKDNFAPLSDVVQPEDQKQRERANYMTTPKEVLPKLMEIDGCIGACIVDSNSGMMLAATSGTAAVNLEVAAAGNTEVVRAKRKTMKSLNLNDQIEDILITLGRQYHLIRPLSSNDALFIYLALDKTKANLAMARHHLASIEKGLHI
ncbi:MAG: DUF4388 domain-containing protein [Myxococcaceae bacterium]|nr:DUF4388 domain-containing protein [Myxococcaceae bacterium]